MARSQRARRSIPSAFATRIRKVEPIGGDCVRIYFAVDRDGVWEDRGAIEIPIVSAVECARFLMHAISEIHTERELAVPSLPH